MKGKRFLLAAAVLVAVLFSSCYITVRGDVYLRYNWEPSLAGFSDTNPNIPSFYDIFPNQYYNTVPGEYYTSYTWDDPYSFQSATYVFNYTLSADYAYLSDPYGPYDAYFSIYLGSDRPYIYLPEYRSLDSIKNGDKTVSNSTAKAVSAISTNKEALGKPTGVIEKSSNGYTIHLEYWKVE